MSCCAHTRALICGAASLWFTSVTSLACGPEEVDEIPPDAAERYADAMCEAYERCDCLGEWFANDTECHAAAVEQFRLTSKWPHVRFKRQCFEDVLKYLEGDECLTVTNELWKSVPCLVFEGTVQAGKECTPLAELPVIEGGGSPLADETCASGTCVAGRCQTSPGIAVGLGESCTFEAGTHCNAEGIDLYCASDGTCRERAAVGESCDAPYGCDDASLYCAGLTSVGGTGVCAERVPKGGACAPDEILVCEQAPEVFCDSEGLCNGTWPAACGLLTYAPGFFDIRDWIPLR